MDAFVIVLGLLLGSFFNVVAIRLLKQQSIAFPPSHCPSCKHPLSPQDLIPIISYVLLKGRCRYCQTSISPLYPLGELVTVLSLYTVYKVVGLSFELIPAMLLTSLLVISVLTDIREKLILNVVTFPFIGILVIVRLFIGEGAFWYYLIGGIVGFSLLLLISIASKGGMGGGDIKLYAAIGLVLGPWLTVMSFVLASFVGAIVGIFLLLTGKVNRKQPIPFGPYILIGTLTAYLFGSQLWDWYRSFF
ncbi:prepilin peptidase [Halalkalibacter urbisdiaboli]|uniref:prepilin peptidase n=1 Tax=Halalkalibacter urbisdiaboli TaxID=1960589 RepID=UPI000B439DE8|nr:A24 family peptidase [Halalkalibacter urbisdiaboli]